MPVGGSVDEGVLILLVMKRYVREASCAHCLYEAVEHLGVGLPSRVLCPSSPRALLDII